MRNGFVSQYKISIFTPQGHYDKTWEDIAEPVDFTKEYQPVEAWVEEIKAQRLTPAVTTYTTHATYSKSPRHGNKYYDGHYQYPYTYAYGGSLYDDEYDYIPATSKATKPASPWLYSETPSTDSYYRRSLTDAITHFRNIGDYASIADAFMGALTRAKVVGQDLTCDASAAVDGKEPDVLSLVEDDIMTQLSSVLEAATILMEGGCSQEFCDEVDDIMNSYGYEPDYDVAPCQDTQDDPELGGEEDLETELAKNEPVEEAVC